MKTLKGYSLITILMSLILLLTITTITGCNKLTFNQLTDMGGIAPGYLSDTAKQLVIWKKPGETMDHVIAKINDIESDYGDIRIAKICGDCDTSLMLLVGPGAEAYINAQGQTASGGGGTGKPGAGGDDGPFFYSGNFHIVTEDSADACYYSEKGGKQENQPNDPDKSQECQALPLPQDNLPVRDPVVVAVIDTGIDTTGIKRYLYDPTETAIGHDSKSDNGSCLGRPADAGWGFLPYCSTLPYPWFDDHPSRHGTVVSHLILQEVLRSGGNSVRLLPVKILDREGKGGRLYDFLCALQYAKSRGARIINASLGFYSEFPNTPTPTPHPYPSAALLSAYIQTNLTESNILLVCAAGNQFHHEYSTRNLDDISFYPASLARELQNVFAVTTVNTSTNDVSLVQNFSNHVIDIGVNRDPISTKLNEYYFVNPLIPGRTVNGTSFATPMVTGMLCANYDIVQGMLATTTGTSFNKSALILNIETTRHVIQTIPAFSTRLVKDGKILHAPPL